MDSPASESFEKYSQIDLRSMMVSCFLGISSLQKFYMFPNMKHELLIANYSNESEETGMPLRKLLLQLTLLWNAHTTPPKPLWAWKELKEEAKGTIWIFEATVHSHD